MSNVLTLFKKEFTAYFLSPIAYIVLTVFVIMNNIIFWVLLSTLSQPFVENFPPMSRFIGENLFLWIYLFIVVPIITMRLLAEEQRSGTIEPLMTAPVTDTQVVLGKYFAALSFYLILWIPTLIYVAVIYTYGSPDTLKIVAGYLGIVLLGMMFMSFGLFCSSLTRNQIVASILTFLLIVGFWLIGIIGYMPNVRQRYGKYLDYASLWRHLGDFSKGIVDTRVVVLYVSITALFLFLTVRVLEARKWR